MKTKNIVLILLINCALSLPAQSDILFNGIYSAIYSEDVSESSSAFVLLSKIELDESELETIEKDYTHEDREIYRMFFEYTLSIRKQEHDYIEKYIKSCKKNINFLTTNKTKIISIASPYYIYLKDLAYTNDDALNAIFEIYKSSDSSISSTIEEDLLEIKQLDKSRFEAIKNRYRNIEIQE